MLEVNVREARAQLGLLLNKVEKGEEVILTRHGKQIAKIAALKTRNKSLPSLKEFRSSIAIKGDALGKTVIHLRDKERY